MNNTISNVNLGYTKDNYQKTNKGKKIGGFVGAATGIGAATIISNYHVKTSIFSGTGIFKKEIIKLPSILEMIKDSVKELVKKEITKKEFIKEWTPTIALLGLAIAIPTVTGLVTGSIVDKIKNNKKEKSL